MTEGKNSISSRKALRARVPAAMRRNGKLGMIKAGAMAAAVVLSGGAQAQTLSPETAKHLKASVKNGGGDVDVHNYVRNYSCAEIEDDNLYDRWSAERRNFRIPLVQIFDDMWYVGSMFVGQYIMKTPSGGFILIDALNNTADIDNYTMPALRALGWKPSTPVYAALITHGHGDHDGGANRLRELFPNIEIYIGSGDARNKQYSPITIDSANFAPQERTIGGVPIVFQSMPGHTPGALYFVVPVHQDGKQYKLMQGGRNGAPGAASAARQYMTSMERAYYLAKQYNVDGTFHVHPNSDGSIAAIQQIQRAGREPNPFIIGNQRTLRGAAALRECAAAWLATRDATAAEAVWRTTSITLPELKPGISTFSAQLTSGWGIDDPDAKRATPEAQWGPMANQTVTFRVDGGAPVCTAVTNAQGVASCALANKTRLLPNQKVIATFAGQSTDTIVNLPSTVETVVPSVR